jgi:hypothetical protein
MNKLLTTITLSILLVSLASFSYGQNVDTINYSDGGIYVGEVRDGESRLRRDNMPHRGIKEPSL